MTDRETIYEALGWEPSSSFSTRSITCWKSWYGRAPVTRYLPMRNAGLPRMPCSMASLYWPHHGFLVVARPQPVAQLAPVQSVLDGDLADDVEVSEVLPMLPVGLVDPTMKRLERSLTLPSLGVSGRSKNALPSTVTPNSSCSLSTRSRPT